METLKNGYLSLYSGWSMHHCSHSGIRQPSLACCSIVVPSSILHRSRYGKIRSMSYHDWSLLLFIRCADLFFFSCKKGKRCDNLYLYMQFKQLLGRSFVLVMLLSSTYLIMSSIVYFIIFLKDWLHYKYNKFGIRCMLKNTKSAFFHTKIRFFVIFIMQVI